MFRGKQVGGAVLLAAADLVLSSCQANGSGPVTGWSPSGYTLIGTEPFWGGSLSATQIVYTTPENQAGERISVTATIGPASEIYTGTREGRPFVLTLTPGPCSDGMSDNVHGYTALLKLGSETRQGCANRR